MDIRHNPLVRLVDGAKYPSRWWVAWIMAWVIYLGGGIAGYSIATALLGDDTTSPLHQYSYLPVFGLILLALFIWVRFKEGRSLSNVGFRGDGGVRKFLLGLAIGAAMMSVPVFVLVLTGIYDFGASEHTKSGIAALPLVVPLLIVFGIQGSLWLISRIHVGWNFFQGNVFGLPVSGQTFATSLFSIGPADGASEIMSGGDYGVEASLAGAFILVIALLIALSAFRTRARVD